MAKKPVKRTSKPKSETIVAYCNSCMKEVPVLHVNTPLSKMKWTWRGKVCDHVITGTRRVQ